MSYEYSAASGRFEIPNPYRIENLALICGGAIAAVAGLVLLIVHRAALSGGNAVGIKAIATGLALLFVGLAVLGRALTQLRYFFGRGRPHNLYGPEETLAAKRAEWLKENLRQNALAYREPQGAIDGLVHHVFDTLIFAPEQIRRAAEAQCFNLLLTFAILLGMLSGLLFYPDPSVRSWIAVAFLLVLIPKLVRPFAKRQNTYAKARAGVGLVVLIIALPIIGPPVLAQIAPALPDISGFLITRTLLISLVILLVAQALFFLALMQQLRARPHINMACEQRSLSMNGNPAKLFEELERTLQTRWSETIPNRRYDIRKPPDVLTGQSGSFEGTVLEETQPTPASATTAPTIVEQLVAESTRPIIALTALALATFIAAVIMAVRFAFMPIQASSLGATLFLTIVLLLVAQYCRGSAHLLWGRVDFQSLLLWIEIGGSFEEAQLNIGNQFTAAMSSTKKVINIESMTLRVWAAELDSVIFDKDGYRDLIGMRGRPDMAQFYANHLETFAHNIASVIAPSASADAERIARISRVQQQLGTPLAPPAAAPAMLAATAPRAPIASANRVCTNPACGREGSRDATFCAFCGTRLAS